MELHELSNIWNSDNQSIEENLKINQQLFKEVSIQKIKSSLTEFKLETAFEIVANSIFLFFIFNFIFGHFEEFKYAVPALIVVLLAAVDLGISIYKIILYSRLNVNDSILRTQKRIETLNYYVQLEKKSLFITIPLFSVALLIIGAKSLLDIDMYLYPDFLLYWMGGSLAVACFVVLIISLFPDKNFRKTVDFLKEIEDLEA